MSLKEKMRIQAATAVGIAVSIAVFILMLVCLRAYKELALLLGIWKEPSWVDVSVMVLSSPLLVALIAALTRWLLIYKKWV